MQIELNVVALQYLGTTFFTLLFCHFLADFPLQGDFMAKAKNPLANPFSIWFFALFGHCIIHAGFIFLLTKRMELAGIQFITHFVVDYSKCVGAFGLDARSFAVDQLLHIAMLFLIALMYCSP